MKISLLFLFKDGARSGGEPVVKLDGGEGHFIPLVTDRVVLSHGAWHVEERFLGSEKVSLKSDCSWVAVNALDYLSKRE